MFCIRKPHGLVFEAYLFFLFENGTFHILKLNFLLLIIRSLRDKERREMSIFEMLTSEMLRP